MSRFKILFVLLMILLKMIFFIYPAIIITFTLFDPRLKEQGESTLIPVWFETTTHKFNNWAETYLDTKQATTYRTGEIAKTEWPMFGAVFYLQTVETLQKRKIIDTNQLHIKQAIKNAVTIITSPDTATWVKKLWKKHYLKTGKSYLEDHNIFYRMLLTMGLSSYQTITQDNRYHTLLTHQYHSLYSELLYTKYHLRDDYPDQCYPIDVLWALVSIQNANTLNNNVLDITPLRKSLLHTFKTVIKSTTDLPAFQANSRSGDILQEARGSSTSGMLLYTSYLDKQTAKVWYKSYEKHFLKESAWFIGFREFPKGMQSFMDVDTGPIIYEYGSIASLFGIGASKSMGRLDHAVPMSIEAIAFAWPTPFGFLLPSLVGKSVVDSWALGDVALLYSMTREINTTETTPFEGSTPWSIWIIIFTFFTMGIGLIWLEIRWIKRLLLQHNNTKEE